MLVASAKGCGNLLSYGVFELGGGVHSFDPCLSCSVHLVQPGRKNAKKFVVNL